VSDDLVKRLCAKDSMGIPLNPDGHEAAYCIKELEAAQGRLIATFRVNMIHHAYASHKDVDELIRAALGEKKDAME
jgi:hypothetical protein